MPSSVAARKASGDAFRSKEPKTRLMALVPGNYMGLGRDSPYSTAGPAAPPSALAPARRLNIDDRFRGRVVVAVMAGLRASARGWEPDNVQQCQSPVL